MPVSIIFNQINVNSVEQTAGVNTGQNNNNEWSFQGKTNSGMSFFIGMNVCCNIVNMILDPDVIDLPVTQPEIINPQISSQL
ncbi:MAG: hypothetical protein ACRC5C_15385 [Bacilli bacterium]